MLRQPKHKRKERDIPSGCCRKTESLASQLLENRNTQPHISQTPENKKCPFLNEKETSFSCHMDTVINFATKVYISQVCCKFSSAFFSILPDISFYLPFLYYFHARWNAFSTACITELYKSIFHNVSFSLRKGHASRGIIMYGKAKIKRVTFPFFSLSNTVNHRICRTVRKCTGAGKKT